jgi:hypothetical protein
MRSTLTAVLATGLLIVSACSATSPTPSATQPMPPCGQEATFSTFELGAVWSYESRPGEEASTFTVRCIEETPGGGRSVHIEVDGVSIQAAGGTTDSIGHLAVTEDSLTEVIVERVGFDDGPASQSFVDGYSSWRDSNGGVWTVPLAQVIDDVEATVGGS